LAIREFVALSNPSAKDDKTFKITAEHFKMTMKNGRKIK